jgi:hypothetical protein
MAEGLLEQLRAIDPIVLTNFVQQDQDDPSFEISSWDVKRLSDKGIANPDGLWLFSGTGGNEHRPWFIVLKIMDRPPEEPPSTDWWSYWKREFSFVRSNLSQHLPHSIKAPRIYHAEEKTSGCWIWMEYVTETQLNWTLDDYAFAAHQFGLWNGSYLTGTSLPSENWFARQHYRSWLNGLDIQQDIQFPLNQKYLSKETLSRFEQLWNEREIFFSVLENLPQVFSHFDSQRRNLMLRSSQTHQKQLVLLDWGQCGIGAIGAELTWLIGFSAALLEWSPKEAEQLDQIVFPSYVQGLKESGWREDADLARLGFTSMFTAYIGCALLGLMAWWCAPENRLFALQQFNFAEEELYTIWLPFVDYTLERAEEARTLMMKFKSS